MGAFIGGEGGGGGGESHPSTIISITLCGGEGGGGTSTVPNTWTLQIHTE